MRKTCISTGTWNIKTYSIVVVDKLHGFTMHVKNVVSVLFGDIWKLIVAKTFKLSFVYYILLDNSLKGTCKK